MLRQVSQSLAKEIIQEPPGRSIILHSVSSQTHIFGPTVVEEFFRAANWDVLSGIGEDDATIERWLKTKKVDVLGLSLGPDTSIFECKRFIARVRTISANSAIKVLAGGPLFHVDPDHAMAVGADAFALDADEALIVAKGLKNLDHPTLTAL